MNNGENGFKVLRRFPGSKEYIVGETVNANEALNIPIRNRLALEKSGFIEFLAEPADKLGFESVLKENEELSTKNNALNEEIKELKAKYDVLVKELEQVKSGTLIEEIKKIEDIEDIEDTEQPKSEINSDTKQNKNKKGVE